MSKPLTGSSVSTFSVVCFICSNLGKGNAPYSCKTFFVVEVQWFSGYVCLSVSLCYSSYYSSSPKCLSVFFFSVLYSPIPSLIPSLYEFALCSILVFRPNKQEECQGTTDKSCPDFFMPTFSCVCH